MRTRIAFWALLACFLLLAGIVLDRSPVLAPVRSAADRVLGPLELAQARTVPPLGSLFAGRTEMARLKTDNDRLRDTIAELNASLVQLRELELENRRLRDELGYKVENPEASIVPANIVGQDPSNLVQVMIIDKGSQDGLKEGMVVVAPSGLVGRLIRVQGSTSQVLLVSDSRSSIYGVLQRPDTRAAGVVQGQLGGTMIMKYIPQGETVREGDVVVTSGRGMSFPRGLFVGRISQVRQNDVDMFQEATVEPSVNFPRLETVMVLTNFLPRQAG
jgi:rod shape-determining protein MreC